MATQIKFPLTGSDETIGQKHCAHLILIFCKDLKPTSGYKQLQSCSISRMYSIPKQ